MDGKHTWLRRMGTMLLYNTASPPCAPTYSLLCPQRPQTARGEAYGNNRTSTHRPPAL